MVRNVFDKAVIKTMNGGDVKWYMNVPVLALTWIDKKPVHMAGTNKRCPQEMLPIRSVPRKEIQEWDN